MDTSRVYRPAIDDPAKYLILYGGAGSGKSHFVSQKLMYRADSTPGERFLVCRKYKTSIKESTLALFKSIAGDEGFPCHINQSDHSIHFDNGSSIIHAGLDDTEKLKSIAAITGIWIEEATEITQSDFEQLDLRLRGETPSYKQIILTFNPIDHRHWIKEYFIDNAPPETTVLRTTWRDNVFIDEGYRDKLQRLPEDRRLVYDLGEWGMDRRGLIYPEWSTFAMPIEVEAYGLDFGFNAPNALIGIQVLDPVIKVKEYLYTSQMTNQDLIRRLEKIADKRTPVYCDSAEPARIEELARAGFQAFPADKSINDGIDTVKSYTLQIQGENLRNEIISYRWAEDRKTGEVIDKPGDRQADHAMDAMRYAIHSHCKHLVPTVGMW